LESRQLMLVQAVFASATACFPLRKEASGQVARTHARAFSAQAHVNGSCEAVMLASLS